MGTDPPFATPPVFNAGDSVGVAARLQSLSDRVNPVNDALAVTYGSGWGAATSATARPVLGGAFAWIDVDVTRTSATSITAGSDGNMGDSTMFTLPGGTGGIWTPQRTQMLHGFRPGINAWTAKINTDGTVDLTDGYPTASVAQNQVVRILGLYCLIG